MVLALYLLAILALCMFVSALAPGERNDSPAGARFASKPPAGETPYDWEEAA